MRELDVRIDAGVVRVTIYGNPDDDGTNVVLVCHALTGSSRAAQWWPDIIGNGALFDPRDRAIVCVNALPTPYARITLAQIVANAREALAKIGILKTPLVIGGSLGGMQALQWALDFPDQIEHAIVIGAHDHQSSMGIALNSIQRDCIALDPVLGLGLARKLAMLTYKSEQLLRERHDRRPDRLGAARFDVEGYLDHQATIFMNRMDPRAYVALTHAADSFDVRDRRLQGPRATFVGISSDWRFRPEDIRAAASRLGAEYLELQSNHGHDAFLAEGRALARLLEPISQPHARFRTQTEPLRL